MAYRSPSWKRTNRLMVMFSPILAISSLSQVRDGDVRIADVGLVHEAIFHKILLELALSDFVQNFFGFAHFKGLCPVDFLFLFDHRLGHFLLGDGDRIGGGDVHGDIFCVLQKVFVLGDEIRSRS